MSGFQRSVMMAMGGGIDITTTADTENVNLRTLLDAAGFDNDVPTKITYRLNSGVTITSAAAGTDQEGPAWQTGTIGSIHTLIIYINGDIKGYGGVGGSGGFRHSTSPRRNGLNGGDGGDHGEGGGEAGDGGPGGDQVDAAQSGTAGGPNSASGGSPGSNGHGIIFSSSSVQSNSSGDKTLASSNGGVIVGGVS